MFSKTKIFAIVAISVSIGVFLLFSYSCSTQEGFFSANEQVLSGSDLAISDPQIKKEIEFMREEKIIATPLYQKWLISKRSDVLDERDIVIDEKGTTRHDQFYRISKIVENDDVMYDEELLDRKIIQSNMKASASTEKVQLRRAKHMFASVGGTITCRIFRKTTNGRALVTQEWETALKKAVAIWNNQGLKVKFKLVDATNTNIVGGYVNVYTQNRNNVKIFASATSPGTPGYFGEHLIVNSVIKSMPDSNAKIFVFVHELGHIIGLKHTDEFANNNDIFNTAVICKDGWMGDSFMYGAVSSNSIFTDFSACDKQNLKYYWGYGSQVA